MSPFFNTDTRRAQLVHEARLWLGTPFRENCAVRGAQGGVDCINYLHAVFVAVGVCEPQTWTPPPVEVVRHWHEHHTTSRILAWLGRPELRGRVRKIEADAAAMIGDLVALKVQRTEHHLGLDVGPEVLHVAIPAGVVSHSKHDPQFVRLIAARYRVMEVTR